MTMLRRILYAAVSGIFGLIVAQSTAQAHSIGVADDFAMGRSAPVPGELEAFEKRNLRGGIAARGVLAHFKLWPLGKPLRVCFLDGDPQRKKLLADTMKLWSRHANLTFDFGPEPDFATCTRSWNAPIRVTFTDGSSWSYVGTDALSISNRSRPTFSVAVDQNKPFDKIDKAYFAFIVLHEAGHAMGLEHEHQNPEANCDEEFDWDSMFAYFEDYGWDRKKVEFNMRSMVAGPRLTSTPYDPKSVMHYSLPAAFFKKGLQSRCYVALNAGLSDGDKALAARAYPKTKEDRVVDMRGRAAAASAMLTAQAVPMQGSVLRAFAKTLAGNYARTETNTALRFDLRAGSSGRSLGRTEPCAPGGVNCRVTADDSAFLIGADE